MKKFKFKKSKSKTDSGVVVVSLKRKLFRKSRPVVTSRSTPTFGKDGSLLGSISPPKMQRIPLLSKLPVNTQKSALIGFLCLCLVLAGWVLYVLLQKPHSKTAQQSEDSSSYNITDEEYAKQHAKTLERSKPEDNAGVAVKSLYYDELILTKFDAKDYNGVVSSYTQAVQSTSNADLPISTYLTAARAYIQLGDKGAALVVLNRAEQAAKKTTPDADLLNGFLQSINELRQKA